MAYVPRPLDTARITLNAQLEHLVEQLAANTHENWSELRLAQGWRYGPQRDDALRQHPGLVPYESLAEEEKDFDRRTAREVLRAILLLGWQIVPPERGADLGVKPVSPPAA